MAINIFDRGADYDLDRPGTSRCRHDRKHYVGLNGRGTIVGDRFRLGVTGCFIPLRDGKPIPETRGSADADEIVRVKDADCYFSVPGAYYEQLAVLGGDPREAVVVSRQRGVTSVCDVWLECPANLHLLRAAWPRVKEPADWLRPLAGDLWRREWAADVRLLNAVLRHASLPAIGCPSPDFDEPAWLENQDIKITGLNDRAFIDRLRRELPVAKAVALAHECGAFAAVVTGIALLGNTGSRCIPHPPSTRGPAVEAPEGWSAVYSDAGTLLVAPEGFLVIRRHMSSAGSYLAERVADFYGTKRPKGGKGGIGVWAQPMKGDLSLEHILFGWVDGSGFSHLAAPGIDALFPGANDALKRLPMRQELIEGWVEAHAWAGEVVEAALEEVAPTMTDPQLRHAAEGGQYRRNRGKVRSF